VIGRVACVALLAAAASMALGAGSAAAKSSAPGCRASTRLGDRPHELIFRVHCDFEVTELWVEPEDPALVRAVRRHPRLRGGEAQDRFACRDRGNAARCSGSVGREVTIVGALRMHGDRCDTPTRFGIQGGMDCEDGGPGTACPAIGYFAKLRDPEPSGCG